MIDQKDVYRDTHVTVTLILDEDLDSQPADFDCYLAEDIDAWDRALWSYVYLRAEIVVDGATLGINGRGSVEHGSLPGVEADAFELTPDSETDGVVTMGSPAWSVVAEALASAEHWFTAHSADGSVLDGARTWLRDPKVTS